MFLIPTIARLKTAERRRLTVVELHDASQHRIPLLPAHLHDVEVVGVHHPNVRPLQGESPKMLGIQFAASHPPGSAFAIDPLAAKSAAAT